MRPDRCRLRRRTAPWEPTISKVCSVIMPAAVLVSLACASTRTLGAGSAGGSALLSQVRASTSLHIVGYTTHDSVHTPFSGTVRCTNELFLFTPESNRARAFSLPVGEVQSIDVIESTENQRTVLLMLVVAASLLGMIVAGMGFHWG